MEMIALVFWNHSGQINTLRWKNTEMLNFAASGI
jgi:hypothetical protein